VPNNLRQALSKMELNMRVQQEPNMKDQPVLNTTMLELPEHGSLGRQEPSTRMSFALNTMGQKAQSSWVLRVLNTMEQQVLNSWVLLVLNSWVQRVPNTTEQQALNTMVRQANKPGRQEQNILGPSPASSLTANCKRSVGHRPAPEFP